MLLTPVPCRLPAVLQSYSALQHFSKSASLLSVLLISARWKRASSSPSRFRAAVYSAGGGPRAIFERHTKRLSGLKLLRRFTSALILVLADGLALSFGLAGAVLFAGGGSDLAIGLAPLLV